jgi:Tol biopolymer transport system component
MRLQVVTPPTTDPLSFAISPDGLRLTFVGTSDGVPRLWLRPLDEMTAQPMPGTDGATYPFWSPDSQSIAFFAAGKLKRIDIGGGQPQDLADVSGSRGGTWNRNGVILYALGASGLRRVSSSGGESTAATQLGKDQTNHRFPVFLPDGRRYLYFTQGSNQAQGVYLGTLDSAESTRLTAADSVAAYLEPGFLLYMRQGTLVARRLEPSGSLASDQSVIADGVGLDGSIGNAAFSTSSSGVIAYRVGGPGRRQFVWFARAGRQTGVVTPPDANNLQYPTISKDGRRLASDRTVLNNRDLYVADLASSSTAARLTFDADIDATPIWSPDGTRIVFRSSRNGVYDLYQKASNFEGTESPLYKSPLPKTPGDWSPDGRHLVFIANGDRETGLDLWVLPMNGGEAAGEARPLVRTAADESQAAFSPDGRWIAYQSNDGGPTEIYVQPFPGPGGKRQVSIGGGASERWRRDGRELFYLSPDEQLMAVPIRTNGPEFEHGPPVALFKTRLSGAFGNIRPQYDVGVDGRFVMNVTAEETNSPITVLLNWKPAESNRQR